MEKEFKIREAKPTDVPAILGFIRELAEFEKLAHEVVATEGQLRESLFGKRPYAEAIIGELDGKPVAFALFFHSYSTFLARPGIHLEDLYVQPEARSYGIGLKMLKHLAGIAQERGFERFEWRVLDWNTRAISFYESLGAKPLDSWLTYRLDKAGIADLVRR